MKLNYVVACLLCGKNAQLKHGKYPGYQEPQIFQIYHCAHCNTAFSMPRPEDVKYVYDLIYRKGDMVPGYDRYWKYSRNVKTTNVPLDYLAGSEDTYWGVREALFQIKAIDNSKVKILEVGSGLGYLTHSLRAAGYNAVGLDISEAAVELAKISYGDYYIAGDLRKFADQNVGMYDAVIFTEVIEHVETPIHFVKSALKLLKNGGRVIISTPNKSLYPPDFIWESDLPPIHCWWFSEDSINYIAEELGTKLDFIDFSEFYSKFTYLELNKLKKKMLPKPIFDASGSLQVVYNPETKSKLRLFFARNTVFKIMYYILNTATNRGIVRLKRRGSTLCAILQKINAV